VRIDAGWDCEDTQIVTTDIDDEETIRQVVDRLQKKFPDLPRTQIEHVARSEFAALADRPVRDFLTILTERAAKKRLRKAE
jgi:anti-sigma-K factor RskA